MPTVIDLVDYLDMVIEAGENPAQAEIEDIDTINLMTVHSSKGLEFPIVFMINLIAGRFPTRNRRDTIEIPDDLIKETLPTGDEHIQEERRLFYVGMTRAKKYLYMMLGKNYGGKRDTTPSGYLEETGLKIQEIKDNKKDNKLGFFESQKQFKEPRITKIEGKAPDYISYSQIDNYLVCPLRYKFSYTLRVPTPPNCALSFGNTIHETLKEFHTQKMLDQNPTLEDLLTSYEKNWIPLGYDNEKHRKLRYEDGIKLLEKYYEKNKDLDVKHIGLEKNFVLDIGDIKLKGKIDRIDQHPDGEIEIIDYKTGKEKSQKEVDDDVQMTIYTMAAKEALKIEPNSLSLYYVEPNVKLSTSRTQKQVDAQKEIIKGVVEGIKSKNFEPTPGRHCTWCDFKDICPFAEKV
jgi:DNA helicase-2/ATP-dependent DNA helicase PcrA